MIMITILILILILTQIQTRILTPTLTQIPTPMTTTPPPQRMEGRSTQLPGGREPRVVSTMTTFLK
uniref:Uncharacterized protein n=1 Tax=Arundo donax TaxID=35708 RepID=A0A0A9ATG4_ARUDO